MRIAEFIERTNRDQTREQLFATFAGAAQNHGYDRVAFGALTRPEFCPDREHVPAVALNYPEGWVNHYFERKYQDIDPIVLQTPAMWRPYMWSDIPKRIGLSPLQRRFFREAEDAGLRGGVSVPIHGVQGECFVACYASSAKHADGERGLGALYMLAMQFYWAYLDKLAPPRPIDPPKLSPRERECLSWSARGKSAWDIGEILGVSEHTATFHLKNAMTKLTSSNRILAIVKAIRLGLIRP